MRTKIGMFLLLIIPILYSCKTTKKTQLIQPLAIDSSKNITFLDSTSNNFILPQKQKNLWYSTRISIGLSSSDDEISGFIVNKRDSLIYLNINKFGIELFRVVLTLDTITMVNRFEKTYYKGDYSIISKLYGISLTFDMIQSIFLGETFSNFKSKSDNNYLTDTTISISIPRNVDTIHKIAINQQYTINKRTNLLVKNWVKDIQTQQVTTIIYKSHETIENYIFPSLYTIELPGMSVTITTKSSKVNIPGPTSLSIPQKYTPMFPSHE